MSVDGGYTLQCVGVTPEACRGGAHCGKQRGGNHALLQCFFERQARLKDWQCRMNKSVIQVEKLIAMRLDDILHVGCIVGADMCV